MTIVLARELGRSGVRVNTIAPVAATRLLGTVGAGEELADDPMMSPDNPAAGAVWLASPLAEGISGQVLKIMGGVAQIVDGWTPGDADQSDEKSGRSTVAREGPRHALRRPRRRRAAVPRGQDLTRPLQRPRAVQQRRPQQTLARGAAEQVAQHLLVAPPARVVEERPPLGSVEGTPAHALAPVGAIECFELAADGVVTAQEVHEDLQVPRAVPQRTVVHAASGGADPVDQRDVPLRARRVGDDRQHGLLVHAGEGTPADRRRRARTAR